MKHKKTVIIVAFAFIQQIALAQFETNFNLSTLDRTNGFTLNGETVDDFSGLSVSSAFKVFDQYRPDGIGDLSWEGLKSAVQESKLLPTPEGIGGENNDFGHAVSYDNNRVLVGAPNTAGTGVVYVYEFDGLNWSETAVLRPSDGGTGDRFGFSLSLEGDRALIGSIGADGNMPDSGAAYVFEWNNGNWFEAAKLMESVGSTDAAFGWSVSLSGDKLLVGIPSDGFLGSALMFAYDGNVWSETIKLSGDNNALQDDYGKSVSLLGDRAVVGSPRDDDQGNSSGSVYVYGYDGNTWVEEVKLTGNDTAAGDQFGHSVSLSVDRFLVGAYLDDDNGNRSGSAYVFDFDGLNWTEFTKVIASDGLSGDEFGAAVILDGDRALIGSLKGNGSVYVYDLIGANWQESDQLSASGATAFNGFGFAVDLSGDQLVIGGHQDFASATEPGSAYVYTLDQSVWSESAELRDDVGAAFQNFGWSVSLQPDRALVGAYLDDEAASNAGAAYVYDFDGSHWMLTAKLFASDANDGAQFGFSVSLEQDRLLVGSLSEAVYVFELDQGAWNETAILTATDGTSSDRFGWAVDLEGDRALVGAHFNDDDGSNSGSAYVYDFNGLMWVETTKLTASDGGADDRFGYSVSLSDQRALIGAINGDGNFNDTGAAYVFEFDKSTWSETSKLTASDGGIIDQFGAAVSLLGDRAVVGANNADVGNLEGVGSVYIYQHDGMDWTESARLVPSELAAFYSFGHSVSQSNYGVLVGTEENTEGIDFRSVYLFSEYSGNWHQSAKYTVNDRADNDQFGSSVSINGHHALVGSYLDDDRGTDSGSAIVINLDLIYENGFEE